MKKFYTKPCVVVKDFAKDDVIRTSGLESTKDTWLDYQDKMEQF